MTPPTQRTYKVPDYLSYEKNPHFYDQWEIKVVETDVSRIADTPKSYTTYYTKDVYARPTEPLPPRKPTGKWKYAYSLYRTESAKKFLCLGGPFAGLKKTIPETRENYITYNCAGYSGKGKNKCILVYEGDLIQK